MNPLFVVRLAFRNTFEKKLRTFLVITGIALTSSVVVGLFGVQVGLERLVDYEVQSGQSLDVINVDRREVQGIKLDQERVARIQSISGVSEVAESVGLSGKATYHGVVLNAPVYAVSQSYFSMSPSRALFGEVERQPQPESIVVSERVLEVFKIEPRSAVGKTISLDVTLSKDYAEGLDGEQEQVLETREYTIKGVVDRGGLPVMFIDIDEVKDQGLTSVAQLSLRLTDPRRSTDVRTAVERLGMKTSSVQDVIKQINDLFDVIRNILVLFAIIVFVITVASAFTVITLTLMESTQQIGFLRIMGMRHSEVMQLFVLQSIIVTFIGGVIGCVIATVVGTLLNGYARALMQGSVFSQEISVFAIPVLQVIIVLVLSIVVGWIIGVISARRAVRINPREELRL